MTKYSPEIVDTICEQLSTGKSLVTICKAEGVAYSTVMNWLDQHPDFLEKYTRAREAQADYLAEEIIEIADRSDRDFSFDPETQKLTVDGEHIQRARLQIDARKWYAGKLRPKKYSDKLDLNHGGQEDNPVNLQVEFIKPE